MNINYTSQKPQFLTVKKVAQILGDPISTINKQFNRGDWGPVVKPPGASKKISRHQFEQKLKEYTITHK